MTPTTTRTTTTRSIHQLYVLPGEAHAGSGPGDPHRSGGGEGRGDGRGEGRGEGALRPPEQVSLDGVDAEGARGVQLGPGLDADGRTGQSEPSGQPHGGDDEAVVDAEGGGGRPGGRGGGERRMAQGRGR